MLDGDLERAPLSALLTAAFITYLPSHPEDVRAAVQRDWAEHLKVKGTTHSVCHVHTIQLALLP